MRNRISCLFLVLIISCSTILGQDKPPYSGTIFIDGTIITNSDSSTFKSITATGRGQRTVFDRRTSSWNSINAILFKVEWNDGLTSEAQINPEFDEIQAMAEAKKYGIIIGRIPKCLRKDVKSIWIHKGNYPFGGGNNSILIHTEQSAEYEKTGILEETLVHEATHTSLDVLFASSPDWLKAQKNDINSISTYAKDNPTREDVAETFLMWIACRQNPRRISLKNFDLITRAVPNRILFFDKQTLNLSPLTNVMTAISQPEVKQNVSIFPNPFTNFLTINTSQDRFCKNVEVLNLAGKLVLKEEIDNPVCLVNTNKLVKGLYFARISDRTGIIHSQLIMKN